jgi:hypothetical protein
MCYKVLRTSIKGKIFSPQTNPNETQEKEEKFHFHKIHTPMFFWIHHSSCYDGFVLLSIITWNMA